MATSTRSRGRRGVTAPESVETESTEENTVSVTEAETTENAETPTDSAQENPTEGKKRGRKPMDEAERQRRATFRACEAAVKLLRENGFTVEHPAGWENPENARKVEAAQRALQALRDAGIDPSDVLQP